MVQTKFCFKRVFIYFFIATIIFPCFSYAAQNNYLCVIKSELHVNDDGLLIPHKNPLNIGKNFQINKNTGEIKGYPFTNATAGRVEVITKGDSRKSFEVLSTSSPNGRVLSDLIIVEEWHKSLNKPFSAISGWSVYSGTCK